MRVLGVVVLLAGCDDSRGDRADELTRDQYVNQLSAYACDKYEECNAYGEGEPYANKPACVDDFGTKAEALWPINQCGNDQMRASRVDVCFSYIQNGTCTADVWTDLIVAEQACDDDVVCDDD